MNHVQYFGNKNKMNKQNQFNNTTSMQQYNQLENKVVSSSSGMYYPSPPDTPNQVNKAKSFYGFPESPTLSDKSQLSLSMDGKLSDVEEVIVLEDENNLMVSPRVIRRKSNLQHRANLEMDDSLIEEQNPYQQRSKQAPSSKSQQQQFLVNQSSTKLDNTITDGKRQQVGIKDRPFGWNGTDRNRKGKSKNNGLGNNLLDNKSTNRNGKPKTNDAADSEGDHIRATKSSHVSHETIQSPISTDQIPATKRIGNMMNTSSKQVASIAQLPPPPLHTGHSSAKHRQSYTDPSEPFKLGEDEKPARRPKYHSFEVQVSHEEFEDSFPTRQKHSKSHDVSNYDMQSSETEEQLEFRIGSGASTPKQKSPRRKHQGLRAKSSFRQPLENKSSFRQQQVERIDSFRQSRIENKSSFRQGPVEMNNSFRQQHIPRNDSFRQNQIDKQSSYRQPPLKKKGSFRQQMRRKDSFRQQQVERNDSLRQPTLEKKSSFRQQQVERNDSLRQPTLEKKSSFRQQQVERNDSLRQPTLEKKSSFRHSLAKTNSFRSGKPLITGSKLSPRRKYHSNLGHDFPIANSNNISLNSTQPFVLGQQNGGFKDPFTNNAQKQPSNFSGENQTRRPFNSELDANAMQYSLMDTFPDEGRVTHSFSQDISAQDSYQKTQIEVPPAEPRSKSSLGADELQRQQNQINEHEVYVSGIDHKKLDTTAKPFVLGQTQSRQQHSFSQDISEQPSYKNETMQAPEQNQRSKSALDAELKNVRRQSVKHRRNSLSERSQTDLKNNVTLWDGKNSSPKQKNNKKTFDVHLSPMFSQFTYLSDRCLHDFENEVPIKWKFGKKIGSGSFGSVYVCLNEDTGKQFAAKQLAVAQHSDEMSNLEQDFNFMKKLKHPNVVRYLGTEFVTKTNATGSMETSLYVFMEYVSGGSLTSMLKYYGPLSEMLMRRLLGHILLGLEFLHSKRVIHNDIKGANILVSDDGTAKLADFGCSKQMKGMQTTTMTETMQEIAGTLPWMAPEVVRQSGYGRKADIWSVGITIIEMLTGTHPYTFTNAMSAIMNIGTLKEPPKGPESISDETKRLLQLCLSIDPVQRATATDLLNYLKQIKNEIVLNFWNEQTTPRHRRNRRGSV